MPDSYYGNLASSDEVQKKEETTNEISDTPNADSTEENTQGNIPQQAQSSGKLSVSVFAANQLIPVAGATVSVLSNDENRDVLASSTTDRSGKSTTFTLSSPSAEVSQEPTVNAPFSVYRIAVSHPDYYDFIAENVQIFGDILTILPVNLIPLPELSNGERTKVVIIPKQNL